MVHINENDAADSTNHQHKSGPSYLVKFLHADWLGLPVVVIFVYNFKNRCLRPISNKIRGSIGIISALPPDLELASWSLLVTLV